MAPLYFLAAVSTCERSRKGRKVVVTLGITIEVSGADVQNESGKSQKNSKADEREPPIAGPAAPQTEMTARRVLLNGTRRMHHNFLGSQIGATHSDWWCF